MAGNGLVPIDDPVCDTSAAAPAAPNSKTAGANLGKKVAAKALTQTAWYPLVKKVGALVGQQVTKRTVEKTITKAVPSSAA